MRTELIVVNGQVLNEVLPMITLTFNERIHECLTIHRHRGFLWGIVMLFHTPYAYTLGERNSIIIVIIIIIIVVVVVALSSGGIFPPRPKCVCMYFSLSLSR